MKILKHQQLFFLIFLRYNSQKLWNVTVLCMKYAIPEREIINIRFQNISFARVTARCFNNSLPNKAVNVSRLVQSLPLLDLPVMYNPCWNVTSELKLWKLIFGRFWISSDSKCRQLAEALGVSRLYILGILKEFYP